MSSFEVTARRANRLGAWITIVGILPSVWAGMGAFKSGDYILPSSIFFAIIVEYTFVFIAYMVTRQGHRLWQTVKYLISIWNAFFFWGLFLEASQWLSLIFGLGGSLCINGLLCKIAYSIRPILRYDDKILRLTVWSGGKDIGSVKAQVGYQLQQRLSNMLSKYRQILSRVDSKLAGGGVSGARVAMKTCLKLIAELEPIPKLSAEGKKCLGQAYLGLGKAQLVLRQSDTAAENFVKAKALGVWNKELSAALANHYASSAADTPDAIEAYLAYLKERRDEGIDEEKEKVIAFLEQLCRFTDNDLEVLTRNLSRRLAFRMIGVEINESWADSISKRLDEVKQLAQGIIKADTKIGWAHLYMGIAQLFSGDAKSALEDLLKTQNLNTKQPLVNYYLALTYMLMGDNTKAQPVLETSVSEDPRHADSHFQLGMLLLLSLPSDKTIFSKVPLGEEEMQRLSNATSHLQNGGDLCPDRGDYLFYTGLARYKGDEYREAEQCLEKALALEPQVKEYYYLLALAQRELKEYQAVIDTLQQAIKIDAGYQPLHSLLGQVYFEQEDWLNAESICRQAIQMDATDEAARAVFGQALFRLDRYDEAVAELTQISQLKPEAQYCQGRSLMKLDKFQEAIPILSQLIEMDYGGNTLYLLGCAYGNLGNLSGDNGLLDTAISWFGKALAADGQGPEIYLQRANAYMRKGEMLEAYADLEHSYSLAPQYADVAYATGIYHYALGNDDKAETEFKREIDINPDHGPAYYARGLIREKGGDLSGAAELYSASQEHGGAPGLQLHLGIVLSKMGNAEKAIDVLSQQKELGIEENALYYYLGWAYLLNSAYDSALSEWVELLNRHGDDRQLTQDIAGLHYLRGRQLFIEGDYHGSRVQWEECLSLDNREGEDGLGLRAILAEACFRQGAQALVYDNDGDYETARELLQRAVELDDTSPAYNYYLSLAELNTGDFISAASRLEALLNSAPADWRHQYHLALALIQAGEAEKAMPMLHSIIDGEGIPASHLGAGLLLADSYRAAGKWDSAAEALKTALERNV